MHSLTSGVHRGVERYGFLSLCSGFRAIDDWIVPDPELLLSHDVKAAQNPANGFPATFMTPSPK